MTKTAADQTVREMALFVLTEVLEEGRYIHHVLGQTLEKYQYLSKQDRAFLTRLCQGTAEQAIRLDYVLDCYSKVKTAKMKPVIRTILRMGTYQILFLDSVPDSAACNESVKLAQKKGFQNLKGFVNGVLRTIAREKEKLRLPDRAKEPDRYFSIRYSMPLWIVRMWREEYPDETVEQILAGSLEEGGTTVWINTEKASFDEIQRELKDRAIRLEPLCRIKDCGRLSGYDYLEAIPEFTEGKFFVQDESSVLAVKAAGIRPGDTVVDLCSAPGGKTLRAALDCGSRGTVIARDVSSEKTALIQANTDRAGFGHVTVQEWDARETDPALAGKADVVLADVPCSGLGVFRKKSDIKYHASREGIESLVKLQREILRASVAYVKEGGVLLYSTCTISRKENLENVRWILEQFPFELESVEDFLPEEYRGATGAEGYLQLLPGVHPTDGFFFAKMRRKNKIYEKNGFEII